MKEIWGGRIGDSLRWSDFPYFDETRSRKMLKLDRPHGTIMLMSPTGGAVDNHETFYRTQTMEHLLNILYWLAVAFINSASL